MSSGKIKTSHFFLRSSLLAVCHHYFRKHWNDPNFKYFVKEWGMIQKCITLSKFLSSFYNISNSPRGHSLITWRYFWNFLTPILPSLWGNLPSYVRQFSGYLNPSPFPFCLNSNIFLNRFICRPQGRRHKSNPGKTKLLLTFEPFVLQTFALQFWKWQLNS